MFSFVVILAVLAYASAAPATGDCAGGYKNGEAIERGYYFYECQGGQIVPKGCLADQSRRLAIGETVDRKNYRLKCQLDNTNGLSLMPVSCLHNNQEHEIGQEWQDEKNYYTCQADGKALKTVTVGCVHDGKRVALNDKVVDGNNVMVCKPTVNNGSRLQIGGCSQDGQQVELNQSFDSGDFFYNCTRFGVKPAGCIHGGQRLNDGERFHDNDVIYECVIENAKTEVNAVGCAQRDLSGTIIERHLGCYFVDGPVPQQFEYNCKHDPATNTATRVKVRCDYRAGKGVYNIDPGCYREVDDKLVGCVKDASGDLKYAIFQADQTSEASSAGLKFC